MMGYIDYSREPISDIAFIDMKSFYASVECVDLGLHPLKTSLCVMSRADNSTGLILASSPTFKRVFGKSKGRSYDLPFDINTRRFSYGNAKKQGLPTDDDYVRFIEEWARDTIIVPPRMDRYIEVNLEIQKVFKVWGIEKMTDFWGIGKRMEARLNKLGIFTIKELANSNPDILQKSLGVVGVRLWFHANGIDESNVHRPYKAKSKGLGNSQVLPRDYVMTREIEIVLREMAEQVAIRLRKAKKKTTVVAIHLGYSRREHRSPISAQMKIDPTNNTDELINYVLRLFHSKYNSGAIRNIAVNYSGLVDESYSLISLFDDVDDIEKEERLQVAIDTIRDEFGFTSLLKANALDKASRTIERSNLIGGHSAGRLDGLK